MSDRGVMVAAGFERKVGHSVADRGQSALTAVTPLKGLLKGLLRDKALTGADWVGDWLRSLDRELWAIHRLGEQISARFKEEIRKDYRYVVLDYSHLSSLETYGLGHKAPVGRLRFRTARAATRDYGVGACKFIEPFGYQSRRGGGKEESAKVVAMMEDLRLRQPEMYERLKVWDSLVHQVRRDQLLIKSEYGILAQYYRDCSYARMAVDEPELELKTRDLLLHLLDKLPDDKSQFVQARDFVS